MNCNKVIFVILAIALAYLLYTSYNPIHNDGELVSVSDDDNSQDNDLNSQYDEQTVSDSNYSDDSMSTISSRMSGGINNTRGGRYRENSYRAQDRDLSGIDNAFKVQDVTQNNNNYTGVDETIDTHASIDVGSNKSSRKENYELDNFLPKEEEKDWFETIETVDVKNSHLINIYKPIGVNTIGSCQKNATYDLRGTDKAVCPKFVVSPWMQSSIEPDRSMKSLC